MNEDIELSMQLFVVHFQEISKASISYLSRDNLRNSLKKLKTSLDVLDKQRKAAIMAEVKHRTCVTL